MTTLILAEHDGTQIIPSVQQAVTAAQFWNKPVHILIAGNNTDAVARQAASIDGVDKVIHAQASHLDHSLAENITSLIVSIAIK